MAPNPNRSLAPPPRLASAVVLAEVALAKLRLPQEDKMRNQFAGICYRCGLHVAADTGYFEKIRREDRKPDGKKWRTQHAYHSHRGGVTCEMAKQKLAEAKKEFAK